MKLRRTNAIAPIPQPISARTAAMATHVLLTPPLSGSFSIGALEVALAEGLAVELADARAPARAPAEAHATPAPTRCTASATHLRPVPSALIMQMSPEESPLSSPNQKAIFSPSGDQAGVVGEGYSFTDGESASMPSPLRWSRTHVAHKTEWHAQEVLVNVQLAQERERVVERLEQVLVVLDHLAAHVDAQPLLVAVQFVAIENVS